MRGGSRREWAYRGNKDKGSRRRRIVGRLAEAIWGIGGAPVLKCFQALLVFLGAMTVVVLALACGVRSGAVLGGLLGGSIVVMFRIVSTMSRRK
jgi:hypothetical protein